MVRLVLIIILFLFFASCGKKGDIPLKETEKKINPAKIDNERIYKF
tara:strand:+ start:839 stop:976 length:138 start_codon:yes stop_codon:yes gene_type:complete